MDDLLAVAEEVIPAFLLQERVLGGEGEWGELFASEGGLDRDQILIGKTLLVLGIDHCAADHLRERKYVGFYVFSSGGVERVEESLQFLRVLL